MSTRLELFNPERSPTGSDPLRDPRGAEEDDIPADEGVEPGRAWSAAFRGWLRKRYGGFADLVLDLTCGRVPYEEVARELSLERWQVWRQIPPVLDSIRWGWIAEVAVDALSKDDGFTVDARTGCLVRPTSGFAVSIRGTNARLANPTVEATEAYLRKYRRRLLSRRLPRRYFGGYENAAEDVFEYDVSIILQDVDEAMAVAVAQRQRAVYDFGMRRSIEVPREGRRAA